MIYKGQRVTFNNYEEVLSDFPTDVQDEVRSALLDGIDLSEHLDYCRDNPYLLQQVRVSAKSDLPEEFFSLPYGSALRHARTLHAQGINLSPVTPYLQSDMSESHFEVLFSWVAEGIPVPDTLNLATVPLEYLPLVDFATRRGEDVTDILAVDWLTQGYLEALVFLRTRGFDIDPLLESQWRIDTVISLPSFVNRKAFPEVLALCNATTDSEKVSALFYAVDSGYPHSQLAELAKYQGYQIEWVVQAFVAGYDTSVMLSREYSSSELAGIFRKLEANEPVNSHNTFGWRVS